MMPITAELSGIKAVYLHATAFASGLFPSLADALAALPSMRWSKPATPTIPETWPPHPPPGETELERAVRLEEEKEAKRRSDAIDREIEQERLEQRKLRHSTRVLLLGEFTLRLSIHRRLNVRPSRCRSSRVGQVHRAQELSATLRSRSFPCRVRSVARSHPSQPHQIRELHTRSSARRTVFPTRVGQPPLTSTVGEHCSR